MREYYEGKAVNIDAKPPSTQARWRESLRLFNCFLANESGISYAAQGYHIGDGVTLRADVVYNHLFMKGVSNHYGALKKQQRGIPNRRKGRR